MKYEFGRRTQKIYDSEIHVDIGWRWDGGIDVSIGNDEVKGNVGTVAEVLPWLQDAIAKHFPESKYHVERMGGTFVLMAVDFLNTVEGILRDTVPAVAPVRPLIYVFASVSVTIFIWVFSRSKL